MTAHNFQVSIGDQVFLQEGGEEVGAVRKIARDHLVVYIENAGDFDIPGHAVRAAHDSKVILDPSALDARVLEAAAHAHESETAPELEIPE